VQRRRQRPYPAPAGLGFSDARRETWGVCARRFHGSPLFCWPPASNSACLGLVVCMNKFDVSLDNHYSREYIARGRRATPGHFAARSEAWPETDRRRQVTRPRISARDIANHVALCLSDVSRASTARRRVYRTALDSDLGGPPESVRSSANRFPRRPPGGPATGLRRLGVTAGAAQALGRRRRLGPPAR